VLFGGSGLEWRPPPPNAYLPTSFEPPAAPMVQVGYRLDMPEVHGSGFGRLQLPGCVERRTLARMAGSRAALADAMCLPTSALVAQRPLAVAAVQLFSSRPAAASSRAAIQGELWRLTLLQAVSQQAAAAARAGLKCDVTYNARGMRLLVSGYAQRAPHFLLLLLQQTLRHVPPSATSSELAAARRVGMAGLGRAGKPARTLENLADMSRTTPAQMQQEIERFFASMTGASLLLAGAVGQDTADSISEAVSMELKALLPRPSGDHPSAMPPIHVEPAISLEDALEEWAGLLYKPVFANGLAQNACLDPAIARALDQCGGI